MVPLILFVLFTFTAGCAVVGAVVVDARRQGRPLLPGDRTVKDQVAEAVRL